MVKTANTAFSGCNALASAENVQGTLTLHCPEKAVYRTLWCSQNSNDVDGLKFKWEVYRQNVLALVPYSLHTCKDLEWFVMCKGHTNKEPMLPATKTKSSQEMLRWFQRRDALLASSCTFWYCISKSAQLPHLPGSAYFFSGEYTLVISSKSHDKVTSETCNRWLLASGDGRNGERVDGWRFQAPPNQWFMAWTCKQPETIGTWNQQVVCTVYVCQKSFHLRICYRQILQIPGISGIVTNLCQKKAQTLQVTSDFQLPAVLWLQCLVSGGLVPFPSFGEEVISRILKTMLG